MSENVETPNLEAWEAATPKAEISTAVLDEKIQKMQEQWAEVERTKKIASEARELYDQMESEVMGLLKAAGKSKYYVEGLGTAYIVNRYVVKTPKTIEAKKQFFKYLREKGEDVLFGMATVNHQTLNGFYNAEIKAATEAGKGLGFKIPGLEEPTHEESLGFRKG